MYLNVRAYSLNEARCWIRRPPIEVRNEVYATQVRRHCIRLGILRIRVHRDRDGSSHSHIGISIDADLADFVVCLE